jgi:hypothetical protein
MHLCQIVECRFREILLCSTCLISAYAVLFSWNKFVVQISMQYFSHRKYVIQIILIFVEQSHSIHYAPPHARRYARRLRMIQMSGNFVPTKKLI